MGFDGLDELDEGGHDVVPGGLGRDRTWGRHLGRGELYSLCRKGKASQIIGGEKIPKDYVGRYVLRCDIWHGRD